MKTIEEIFAEGRDPQAIITDLMYYKQNVLRLPPWVELVKEYDPMQHKIMIDKAAYPDKPILDDNDQVVRVELVTRIGLGLQRLASQRISEFMFTIPVQTICEDTEDEVQKQQYAALKKVLVKNKWNSLNKQRCRIISSECECATLWYAVKQDNNNLYGFKANLKLRKAVFSPALGDTLYPSFDDMGHMIAFSRQYSRYEGLDNKATLFFETWTADKHILWRQDGGWVVVVEEANVIGKIPIIYGWRKQPIWRDADHGKVHEMEKLLSKNGDTLDYHASPVLLIKGKLQGTPSKGEANKIFQTNDPAADGKYISWTQAPEAVKFQFETLVKMFHQELQLPELSFDNIKSANSPSGEARKWLLIDAMLKVGDEAEIFDEMIKREYNVIKAFLGKLNASWGSTIEDLEVEPFITAFLLNDEKDTINNLVTATGGQPILSQQTAIKLSNMVDNPDEELKIIQDEANVANFGSGAIPANG